MLTPEAARQRLQQWLLRPEEDDDREDEEGAVPAPVARLPKPLRPLAYALLGRDAAGKPVRGSDWEKKERHLEAAFAELDGLPGKQRVRLFEGFFPKLAEDVERGWQLLRKAPFQSGYVRKSFRAPGRPELTLPNRRQWLEELLALTRRYQPEIVTAPWLAAWAPYLEGRYGSGGQDTIGRLLAAVIDAGSAQADEVFDILTASARNEHETGGMGRHVTRGLLLASRPEGWELIEKLLLAAQRQEGLRQAVLETVDEAHPQAFRRMLRLIMEHDLARFSAVVRAVNVWFGYLWDSVSVKVVNDTIEKVLRFLDDEQARQRALEGKDAPDVFLALWSIAFEDAPAAIPVAARLLRHPRTEHRYVAALHLTQLGLKETHPVRLTALDDDDLRVAFCALTGLCNAMPEKGKPGKMGSYPASPSFHFPGLHCKAP